AGSLPQGGTDGARPVCGRAGRPAGEPDGGGVPGEGLRPRSDRHVRRCGGVGLLQVEVTDGPRRLRAAVVAVVVGVVVALGAGVDPGGRGAGWLADDASVRAAPDRRSATFTLRSGARWSDGAPITVDDLRFTVDTVRGDAWPGPRAGYDRLTAVDGVGASVTF